LTQFKDAITRADDANSVLQNLLRQVRAAERAVESAEQQKSSWRSLVQNEYRDYLFQENKEDAGNDT
jgi:regulator of sirC expression with transglutaminase-like and TPR domain